jgi:hypothetical protein
MAAPGGPAPLRKKAEAQGLELPGGHPADGRESWGSSRSGRSPTARRPLTISESPMRERSAGTAMAVVGIRSGGGSFVTKRTRTWRDGSASMAAAAGRGRRRVLRVRMVAGFNRFRVGRTFLVLPDKDARSMYIQRIYPCGGSWLGHFAKLSLRESQSLIQVQIAGYTLYLAPLFQLLRLMAGNREPSSQAPAIHRQGSFCYLIKF